MRKSFGTVLALLTALLILPAHAAEEPLAATGQWTPYTAGHAQAPSMGWSSCNAFATDIDEDKIVGSAQALVRDGLAAKGYRYVHIDDGWALQHRWKDRAIPIRPGRFPYN
jgi:alpha-galactosidase